MDGNKKNVGKFTEEALKRKERLKKLREQRAKSNTNSEKSNSETEKRQIPVFRSYQPQNENTIGEVLEQKPSGDIEMAVETQLELLKEPAVVDEIDIASLAPRKLDWDLKRDVAKKLEYLDRRTQKIIAELIRERLKTNQTGEDIFQAVSVGTAHAGEVLDN